MINWVHFALILLGLGLRLLYFACGDVLSLSEAYYVENIVSRSYREIIYHIQILPNQPLSALGFYLLQKGISEWGGETAFFLRLYPLVCSLVGVFACYFLSRLYLNPFGVSICLAFFCLSEWLVVSAGVISPLASDVLLSMVAVIAYEWVKRREFEGKAVILLTILGAITMWMSFSVIIVWFAILLLLLNDIISLQFINRLPSLMGLIAVWVVNFLCLYLVCLSHLIQSPYVWYQWQVAFSVAPFWSLPTLYWTLDAFIDLFVYPMDLAFPLIGVIVCLAGAAGFIKKFPAHAAVIGLPIIVTFLLASFRMYPAFGQGVLFILPAVFVLMASGIAWLQRSFNRVGFWLSMLLFAFLVIQPVTHLTDAFAAVWPTSESELDEGKRMKVQIVLIGDSLIELNEWSSFLKTDSVQNFGVSGDKINDVRRRLAVVRGYAPAKIVVHVGINNHPSEENREDLIRQYRRLIVDLQRLAPQSQIYISTVLPINNRKMEKYFGVVLDNEAIRWFNRGLFRLAMERRVRIIDSHRLFFVNNEMHPEWTSDGVHLSRSGYMHWRPLLLEVLKQE